MNQEAQVQVPAKGFKVIQYIQTILPGSTECPSWPPDMFGVVASILRISGAYTRVVEHHDDKTFLDEGWPDRAKEQGEAWRESWKNWESDGPPGCPEEVEARWKHICDKGQSVELADVRSCPSLTKILIEVCAIADEACLGIGAGGRDALHRFAEARLFINRKLSICNSLDSNLLRVLPKRHTPQRGLTLRSLSRNVCLIPASDAAAIWNLSRTTNSEWNRELLNILFLPWPLTIERRDFSPLTAEEERRLPSGYGYFKFDRSAQDPDGLEAYMTNAIKKTKEYTPRIDVILFPELALTRFELEKARDVASSHGCILIAGVALRKGDNPLNDQSGPANVVFVQTKDPSTRSAGVELENVKRRTYTYVQRKHHRWCLDWNQIRQYGLSGILVADKKYWEHSKVERREANFWLVSRKMLFSVLICEDLARQDPVADVIREVGPNMIFALLMDGPQLKERWGAKHASVLADDPGSSVLTVTSLGMARLSKPLEQGANVPNRSKVVALWRDSESGQKEIELQKGENAVLLNVVCRAKEEWTCDGRSDREDVCYPVLSGSQTFEVSLEPGDGLELNSKQASE